MKTLIETTTHFLREEIPLLALYRFQEKKKRSWLILYSEHCKKEGIIFSIGILHYNWNFTIQ